MGSPPQDHPGGPARCILGRDLPGNADQDLVGSRPPERGLAAARDARDYLLGPAASAPACDRRLPGSDAEIDAEAQSGVPRAEAAPGEIAQSELSGGHRHAERSNDHASRRVVSGRVAASRQSAGALAPSRTGPD